MTLKHFKSKDTFSWILYDWANSAFATTVMAGFFPVFFKMHLSEGIDPTLSTFYLGIGNSAASIILAFIAPALGCIADFAAKKKNFLLFFLILGVFGTLALGFLQAGQWEFAVIVYILGILGFYGSNIFYDSLLLSVTPKNQMDMVSSLGFAIGYLGGGLLFLINVLMFLFPEFFFISSKIQAVKLSFISVGIWWTIFSIPLFFYVKEPPALSSQNSLNKQLIIKGFKEFFNTLKEINKYKNILLFLIAYFCYIDGIYTIIKMSVDYGLSIGFKSEDLIVALLMTQFIGFPATLFFGRWGEKYGAKSGITIGIIVYTLLTFWAYFMTQSWEFYAIAACIGLVQGCVQSLSRSFYGSLIPKERAGEFFGFYNMIGKYATILGPLLVGFTSYFTKNSRLSILTLVMLFIIGLYLLHRCKTPIKEQIN